MATTTLGGQQKEIHQKEVHKTGREMKQSVVKDRVKKASMINLIFQTRGSVACRMAIFFFFLNEVTMNSNKRFDGNIFVCVSVQRTIK